MEGSAADMPDALAGRRFDLVTMTHVLEQCLDPVRAPCNPRDKLAPRATLYCEVPNAGSRYFRTYGEISEMLDVPRHLHSSDGASLADAAAGAGLEVVSWQANGYVRHVLPGSKAWENGIHDRLVRAGRRPVCAPRSAPGDRRLMMAGLLDPPGRRYDPIATLARRGDGA